MYNEYMSNVKSDPGGPGSGEGSGEGFLPIEHL